MKAIILAGGQGTRLRPLTNDMPKPLIEVAGKPIIVHQIEWLKKYGIMEFIVTIGYLKEKFLSSLGSGRKYGVHVSYVVEEEPLGTGGGLKNAISLLGKEEMFYVVNGDVITDINATKLIEMLNEDAIGVIATVPLPSPYGIVFSDSKDYIVLFQEKPIIRDYWINAGLYLFRPEVFKYLPDRGDLERESFPKLTSARKLKTVRYYDFTIWRSIETLKDLEEAEKILIKKREDY
ncbi:MAG: nucleotidyltransferase family protein [Candidatus Bathyarchaeia archaeon]